MNVMASAHDALGVPAWRNSDPAASGHEAYSGFCHTISLREVTSCRRVPDRILFQTSVHVDPPDSAQVDFAVIERVSYRLRSLVLHARDEPHSHVSLDTDKRGIFHCYASSRGPARSPLELSWTVWFELPSVL